MEKPLFDTLTSHWDQLQTYLKLRLELIKLQALEKSAKLIADLISNTVMSLCGLLAFLAASVTLAFYFSQLFDSYTKGFGVATIFFTLVAIVILKTKTQIEKAIGGMAIKRYFEKHCEK